MVFERALAAGGIGDLAANQAAHLEAKCDLMEAGALMKKLGDFKVRVKTEKERHGERQAHASLRFLENQHKTAVGRILKDKTRSISQWTRKCEDAEPYVRNVEERELRYHSRFCTKV